MTTHKRLLLAMILGLLASPLALYAQDEDEAAAESGGATQESAGDDELIITDTDSAADDEATEAADTPVASNEDFNPSVQISEDLSVSFPVDI